MRDEKAIGWAEAPGGGSFPPINIFQQDHDFVAVVELPGVDRDDLEIEIKGDAIRISGKKEIAASEGASVHRRERRAGAFDRAIVMPVHFDADGVQAEVNDGVLALFIPRADSDKPRAINVTSPWRRKAMVRPNNQELSVQEKREADQRPRCELLRQPPIFSRLTKRCAWHWSAGRKPR